MENVPAFLKFLWTSKSFQLDCYHNLYLVHKQMSSKHFESWYTEQNGLILMATEQALPRNRNLVIRHCPQNIVYTITELTRLEKTNEKTSVTRFIQHAHTAQVWGEGDWKERNSWITQQSNELRLPCTEDLKWRVKMQILSICARGWLVYCRRMSRVLNQN